MQKYKFQGDYRLRKVFQTQFKVAALRSQRLIIPIPLHPGTYRQRGFNQVTGLLGDVNVTDVLRTVNDHKDRPQSSKKRRERLALTQPFQLSSDGAPKIQDRDVLIVDDVYTTGATIRSAARLLKKSGARLIRGLTLAH